MGAYLYDTVIFFALQVAIGIPRSVPVPIWLLEATVSIIVVIEVEVLLIYRLLFATLKFEFIVVFV